MPVNMDPSKRRRRTPVEIAQAPDQADGSVTPPALRKKFGEETDADREKDLAEAELKNLWDATEVIDMDRT
jgi:hypothetical protein